ncbi:MAG: hypothetical protein ACW96N_09190, partial [Candidatus Thorarchaeota archaeon]
MTQGMGGNVLSDPTFNTCQSNRPLHAAGRYWPCGFRHGYSMASTRWKEPQRMSMCVPILTQQC